MKFQSIKLMSIFLLSTLTCASNSIAMTEEERARLIHAAETMYDNMPEVIAADCPAGKHWETDPRGGIAFCATTPTPPVTVAPTPVAVTPPVVAAPAVTVARIPVRTCRRAMTSSSSGGNFNPVRCTITYRVVSSRSSGSGGSWSSSGTGGSYTGSGGVNTSSGALSDSYGGFAGGSHSAGNSGIGNSGRSY